MPYRVLTVRVSKPISAQCRELAKSLGWQLSDMLRTLVCIGATFQSLAAQDPEREEAAKKLLNGLKLLTPSGRFSLRFPSRPYAYRLRGRKSSLLTLSVPESLCVLIDAYAEIQKASRNEACNTLLQQGLLIYLKAQASLLKPFQSTADVPQTSVSSSVS